LEHSGQLGQRESFYVDSIDGLNEALVQIESTLEGSDLYLDIETTGLNPRTDFVRLLQVCSADSPVYVIGLDKVFFPDRLKVLLNRRTVVGHNLLFDSAFLKARYGIEIQKTWDTLIASRLLHAGVMETEENNVLCPVSNDLTAVVKRYLGLELGEDHSRSDWGKPELSQAQPLYAAGDVAHLPELKATLAQRLQAEEMLLAFDLDN
jgi:DNA polymerase I